MIVGFGTYREGLEVLLRGLERADEQLLMHVCRQGRALEGGPRDQLTYLRTFLEALAGRHERYFAAAKKMRESIVFTGRLEHGELARVLPCAEEIVVPSMFPEAFGMVAAEGAACGALPICAGHSGLAEVTSILGEKLPPQVRQLLTFERGMHAVEDLASAMTGWLDLDERLRVSGRVRRWPTRRRAASAGSRWPRTSSTPRGAAPPCSSRSPARCRSPAQASARDVRALDLAVPAARGDVSANLASIVTSRGGLRCRFGMGCRASC